MEEFLFKKLSAEIFAVVDINYWINTADVCSALSFPMCAHLALHTKTMLALFK